MLRKVVVMGMDVYIGTQDYPLPYLDAQGRLKLLCDDDMYIKLPTLFEGMEEDVQAKVSKPDSAIHCTFSSIR